MKVLLFWGILFSINYYSYADCAFEVTNYSSEIIKVKVGFWGHEFKSTEFEIPNTGSRVVKLKSHYDCLSHAGSGLGVAYINLIGGKSQGGWVYSPDSSTIKAIGQSVPMSFGSYGLSPNGHGLVLKNNYKPQSEKFAVVIKDSDRNLSKIGSMN